MEGIEDYVVGMTEKFIRRATNVAKKLYGISARFEWKYIGPDWLTRRPNVSIYGEGVQLMEICLSPVGALWGAYRVGGIVRGNSFPVKKGNIFFSESNIPCLLAHLYVLNVYLLPNFKENSNFYVRRAVPTNEYVEIEISHKSDSLFDIVIRIPAGGKEPATLSLQFKDKSCTFSPTGEDIFIFGRLIKSYFQAIDI